MSLQVNVHEAKTHFSRLLDRVSGGEEVIIARAGEPVARLVPVEKPPRERLPGSAKGEIEIVDDFDAPLPEEVLREFEGRNNCWIPTLFCGGSTTRPGCRRRRAGY